jgi:lysozyme family protein
MSKEKHLRGFARLAKPTLACANMGHSMGFGCRTVYGFDGGFMANVNAAIDYVLGWEDANLSGVITTAPDGKRTRFGIDEHWHPELTNSLFFSSMGQVAALEIARGIYEINYCQLLCIADITDQEVANKLLSLGVNIGVVRAAKMLQNAVTVVGDGRIGPLTLHALDLADPDKVLADLRTEAESYYEELVKGNPDLAVYRAGWLRRAAV